MQQSLKLAISLCLICLFVACSTTKKAEKVDVKLLYGVWKVESIETQARIVGGAAMGNPQYEFTKEGERIKTLNTVPAPPPEKVQYKLEGNEITYPENQKLPSVTIKQLTTDSLVLENETVKWRLYR